MTKHNFIASISGVRGIVKQDLNDKVIIRFALALKNSYIKKKNSRIAIAYDARESGLHIKNLFAKTLASLHIKVIDFGIIPTPTLLFCVRNLKLDGGVVITASHNPHNWNGFKFVNHSGTFFNKTQFQSLMHSYNKLENKNLNISMDLHPNYITHDNSSYLKHISSVTSLCDINLIRKSNFSVALDTVNSAGSYILSTLIKDTLNCKLFHIHENTNTNFQRPPEPLPQNLSLLEELVIKNNCDIGFATDPDADRLAIVSNQGLAIGEEFTLVLAAYNFIKNYGQTHIATNISTSRMIDDLAISKNVKVFRSAVGEANVLDMMIKHDCKIGGEGNGGVIVPSINPCRDSLVAIVLILNSLALQKTSISSLIKQYHPYYFLKEKVEVNNIEVNNIEDNNFDLDNLYKLIKKQYKDKALSSSLIDGIRMDYKDYWFQVRMSNTEPIIRIFVEAKNKDIAKNTFLNLKDFILNLIS